MKCCFLFFKNFCESYNFNKDKGMFFLLFFEFEDENDNKFLLVVLELIKEGFMLC